MNSLLVLEINKTFLRFFKQLNFLRLSSQFLCEMSILTFFSFQTKVDWVK